MPLPLASLIGTVAAGLGFGVARWWRRQWLEQMEAASLARCPVDDSGIIRGASPFVLDRPNAPALLLLHGAGDTPASLRYFGEALHAAGYAVHAPLLPGHGRTIREYATVTADGWFAAARAAFLTLVAEREWVAVAGLSMGGALAVRLAADPELGRQVRALVLLAPYLAPPATVRLAARCSRGWGAVIPYVSILDPRSIQDEAERERALGYGTITPAALRALVQTARAARDALPRVTAPTLVVLSRHDNRVVAAPAQAAFERLGAAEKRLLWRDIGGHILPVDHGRAEIFAAALEWLAAHGGLQAPAMPAASTG